MTPIIYFLNTLKDERNYSPHTIVSYRQTLLEFERFLTSYHCSLLEVDSMIIRSYLKHLQELKRKQITISHVISVLQSFYQFLLQEEIIQHNPMDVICSPSKSIDLPRVLTKDEVERLLNTLPFDSKRMIRDRALLETLYSTGMRVSEALNIRLNDVNLDQATIRCLGKRKKQRIVLLGDYAVSALNRYLNEVRTGFTKKSPPNDRLFLNHLGLPLHRSYVFQMIQRCGRIAGIDQDVSPHMLRHSFATHMLAEEADLRTIQTLLGHSSIVTTQIYTHLTNPQLKAAYDKYHPFAKGETKIMSYQRVFLIVLDSVGIGHSKDAAQFHDEGANTLLHIDHSVNGLFVPTLESLGLGKLDTYLGISPQKASRNSYVGRLEERSIGKDTMTGHWEMMGLYIDQPFQTFTDTGFPKELIDTLEQRFGRKIIGNIAASGTQIIQDLGEEHVKTGALIVYTSADSVMQIAAHESIVPVEELYRYCEIAREVTMRQEWKVGRVIARPFTGDDAVHFARTPRRHDYALSPFRETYLDFLMKAGFSTISVGKINDIFNKKGISEAYKTVSNQDGMKITIDIAKRDFKGLCFVNLVDFDMEFGHRRDVKGYAKSLESFDVQLKELLDVLREDDLLILTADHGNDPTYRGSDHTRENVPFIVYSPLFKNKDVLPTYDTFSTIGATIIENFGVKSDPELLGQGIMKQFK